MTFARWKGFQLDYDLLRASSEADVLVCLSEQDIMALLVASECLSWPTRYQSQTQTVDEQWVREFGAKVREKLMCFACCDTIANCVSTSQAVKDALKGAIVEDVIGVDQGDNENALPEATRSAPLIPAEYVPECNEDNIWGAAVATVDGVFEATREVLELIYLATSPTDLVGEILEAIPIIGGVLDLVVGFTSWVAEHAYLLFQTFDSDSARDPFRCKLFCVGQANCNITASDVWDTFYELSTQTGIDVEEPADVSIDKIIDIVLEGQVTEVVLGTLNLVGLIVMLHGGKFGRGIVGVRSLEQLAAIGAHSFPSDLWQDLCGQCPTTERRLLGYGNANLVSVLLSGGLAVYDPVRDVYDGGYAKYAGLWSAFADIRWSLPAINLSRVLVKFSVHRTRPGAYNAILVEVGGVVVATKEVFATSAPELHILEATGTWTAVTLIRAYGGVNVNAYGNGNLSVARMEYDLQV